MFLSFAIISFLILFASGYKSLSDRFLQSIPSGGYDFDPDTGALLSPFLIPRSSVTERRAAVQYHLIDFFRHSLPRWKFEYHNSSTEIPVSNLVFQREPPWTKPGQANWITFAANYDTTTTTAGYNDGAASCAVLLHVARSIDKYVTQMHEEMAALGEGGTVEMDMGIQILFLDGMSWNNSSLDLSGSR